MRAQRIACTAIIAALLWPVVLYLLDNPLLPVMRYDGRIAVVLILAVGLATCAGIWTIDGTSGWSTGSMPIGGLNVMLTRFMIAFVTLLIFALPYSIIIRSVANFSFSYMDALVSQGFIVVGTVWIATHIVDILVRQQRVR